MTALILDGKATGEAIRTEIAADVQRFVSNGGPIPRLVAVLVGEDPASEVYVRNKHRACGQAGIAGDVRRLPADTTQADLLAVVESLNRDPAVHGILVQLPLPVAASPEQRIDTRAVLDAIDPAKDVDCFSPVNVGLLMQGRPRFLPCTPRGIVELLRRYELSTSGKQVVVIGRSDIVGKPIAIMLAGTDGVCGPDYANATVTMAHSRTRHLAEVVRSADFVIAAVGRPALITGDMVKSGAVVIDVGINRVGDRLVGDVDFDSVSKVAAAITPVPGGVGPLTIAMLLRNTLESATASCEQTL